MAEIDCAGADEFLYYSSGVLTYASDRTFLHAVAIVGYGQQNGTDMWIVRNSWGSSWGQDVNNSFDLITTLL